jgi:phage terminase large subunit-like protein
MDADALALYQRHTGRSLPPIAPAIEAWVIAGRRGGKSLVAALVSVFLAAFRDYSAVLAPGERGTVMVLAADRKQARTVLRYIAAFFDSVPMLARMVESRTAEAIHLTNRVSIEVHTASYRSVRGHTMVAVVADEVAFWRDDSSTNPPAGGASLERSG